MPLVRKEGAPPRLHRRAAEAAHTVERARPPGVAQPVRVDAERTPVSGVVAAVGGRAVAGDIVLARLPGRDTEVMLPKGATFAGYVDALARSGAFPEQAAPIAELAALTASSPEEPATEVDERPRVGIVVSEPRMLLRGAHANTENLIALVEGMGCRPVLIPPCADLVAAGGPLARRRAIAAMASSLDGLIGPGGADVHPAIYGEKTNGAVNTNLVRDRFEADFVRTALDCDLFGFGICRSHQLWNAAAGGKLIQDIEDEHVVSVSHKEGTHPLKVERRSMIFEAVRQEALRVNSLHHQAVDFTGWGFRVVARVHDDGTGKDMIEGTERWNAITTQYHPELMQDDPKQRALFSVVGRRAHAFALLKELRAEGKAGELLARMKADPRYDATDLAWAKTELLRRRG